MVEEITIRKIPVKDIIFDESNPNELTDDQMEALKETMLKFGYLAPVVLNKNLEVIDGEHRVRIYQELGKKNIQAYVLDIDSMDKKILRQLMNKLKGKHDKTKDADEFKAIFESGRLEEFSELLAQPMEDFQQILEKKFNMGFDNEDEVEELPTNPKSKLGEIYQLGSHLIMCGDATKDLNKLLDGIKPRVLFTDPPYGLGGYAGRSGKFEDMKGDDKDVTQFYESLPKDIPERYIWGSWLNIKLLNEIPRDVIIWRKNNFGMGKGYRGQYEICLYFGKFNGSDSDVWDIKKDNVREYKHPTQKPVELGRKAILNSSKKGDIVLDCYLGSGSTLIACEQTDRICYGVEIEPKYIDVVITRWENYTGEKAKLIKST